MAESVKASEDPKVASDVIAEEAYQRVKMTTGADGTANDVSSANPLPVSDAGGALSVDDGGNSLTVDAPLATPVAVRLSDGSEGIGTTAKRLHIDDGGSSLSVDDGSGSLTIDNAALGETSDAEATGNGSIVGLLKRLRKLLEGTGVIKVSKLEEALPAGTNAIGKLAANSGVDIGDVDVTSLPELPAGTKSIGQTDPRGNKAHDEADVGNPIKTGGRARTALPAAVAQDDRSDFMADKHGRQLVTEYPRDQKFEARLNLTNTTETTILEAAGASTRWVVTGILVTNSSASVETKVEIKDDTTAKVIVHAGTRGGGAAPPCPPGGFFIGTENKTVKVKAVTTGADVEVFVCGYKIPA